jgi:hypothetical protein
LQENIGEEQVVGTVKFINEMKVQIYLHMREGPVAQDPDDRGSSNVTIPAGGPLTEMSATATFGTRMGGSS